MSLSFAFELILKYNVHPVWHLSAVFSPLLLTFKVVILCQFKRGKIPRGEKNHGLV